ncbi:cytochrome P450 2J6-like [Megalops cyprinoides]|uniref:cytochrome P450 2J6-like n=1 Tax=Megalops cyprinoides TaxID=118141 RepID=UPI0018640116|nr:cytochrome P450 2J6-like [Megalops cyprinoides]
MTECAMPALSVLSFLEFFDVKFCSVFLVFLIFADILKNKPQKNFPPGPLSLPIVGDLLRIDPFKLHLQMAKFKDQYGDIFSLRLGRRIVVLNGFKLIKEAFVQHGENFVDRSSLPSITDINQNNGLVFSNGYMWKQQRRFALMTLKNFGVGKRSLESSIQVECKWLNEAMGNEQGQPFDPQFTVNNAVSNIICCLVFGDRFEYGDDYFQNLLRLINEVIYLHGSIWAQTYNVVPWIMRRLPGPHQKIFSHSEMLINFVKLKIKEHRGDWDPSAPRDYIDCFLSEMEKVEKDVEAGFNEENLCICTLDLFVVGSETTSTTLYWALLYMIKYPDVQEKVQAEIDRVIGPQRQPFMADRANMPYTDAVIHEIQRMGNIVPLNVPRTAIKDTTLGEYTIPKGTMVWGILTSVLFDESEWETPHIFNPGHFLDGEGNFRKRDAFMAFSAGKRACPGEQLARMELFLFFTSLLQRFTFSPPPGVEPSLDFRMGMTLCPKPYKLCATSR